MASITRRQAIKSAAALGTVLAWPSVFASAALARELLDRGADPNAFFVNEYGEMSALYGAAGVAYDPELTRVLLEAGANPNDGESLYHATEARSPECVRLLLEHGAQEEGSHALAHALDDERRLDLGRIRVHAADDALQVQDDVGDVLRDALDRRELVRHALDPD